MRPGLPTLGGDTRLATAEGGTGLVTLAVACAFAFTAAWLMAWPYVLPWYDSLGWALLALLSLPGRLVVVLDWLMLARTTALGFGYLPARGIAMPSDLAWLRPVLRNGVTPVVLLTVLILLIRLLLPLRPSRSAGQADCWVGSPGSR